MRIQSLKFLPLALFLAACATGGAADEDQPTVPVYGPDEETPCEYEVLGTVTAEVTGLGSTSRLDEMGRRALGQEGAKLGADAVVLPGGRQKLPFTVVRAGSQARNPAAYSGPRKVEGQAVSWIQETCKG